MGENVLSEVRIYCICGQKMKVSESMFGLPGKCIACRQKIRIPFREEIPPGETEIHLKDHPELLRKSRKTALHDTRVLEKERVADEVVEVTLGDPSESRRHPALDVLEPLRVLCSLERKIQIQLTFLASHQNEGVETDQSVLQNKLEKARAARANLDDSLRKRLMEINIELSSVHERTAQAALSARIGEMDFAVFRETTERLRSRREYLERMRENILAWLSVDDPHSAGGYIDASLDAIPEDDAEVDLPEESFEPRSLFDMHLEGLRSALERRERVEARLGELDRIKGEGMTPSQVLEDCKADSRAEKLRSDAEASFRRKRLEQVSNDCAADVQTIQACLERARKNLQSGVLDKARFTSADREMSRAQRDCARIHGLASRALMAVNAHDVPSPSDSLIKRMARPARQKKASAPGADSWITWTSSFMLGICVLLPLMSDMSPVQILRSETYTGSAVHWFLLLPILAGVCATIMGAFPHKQTRGLGVLAVWLAFTCVCGFLIHESEFGVSPIALRFRHGALWFTRSGAALMVLSDFGLLCAACIALLPTRFGRWALCVAVGLCVTVLAIEISDFAGLRVPWPSVDVKLETDAGNTASNENENAGGWGAARPMREASITINNMGHRALILGMTSSDARNSFTYFLERKNADGMWREAANTPSRETRSINPGENIQIREQLPPGEYRARIQPNFFGHNCEIEFTLPGQEQAKAPNTAIEPNPEPQARPAAGSTATMDAEATQEAQRDEVESSQDAQVENQAEEPSSQSPAPKTPTAEVELRGVVQGKHAPRFSVALYPINGAPMYLDLSIGDKLYDPWKIIEFNPQRQSVTVSDGAQIMVLTRGERVPLP
jgi:hypothetical protein